MKWILVVNYIFFDNGKIDFIRVIVVKCDVLF
jgi:hypothetical protein